MLRVMAATAAYGAAHSVLASRAAKEAAAHLLGHRARDAFYRPFYIAQSVAALGCWRPTPGGSPTGNSTG
jgi:hypothetical protein